MPKVKGGRETRSDKRSKVTKQSKKRGTEPSTKIRKSDRDGDAAARKEVAIRSFGVEKAKKFRLTTKKLKELSKLKSEFKVKLPTIYDALNNNDTPEEAHKEFLLGSLAVVIGLIPFMEDQARTKRRESDAYALNALLSQGREIMHDLESLSETKDIAFLIATNILNPAFIALSSTLVNMLANTRDTIEQYIKDPKDQMRARTAFQENARGLGQYLDFMHASMREQIAKEVQ